MLLHHSRTAAHTLSQNVTDLSINHTRSVLKHQTVTLVIYKMVRAVNFAHQDGNGCLMCEGLLVLVLR